MDWRISESKEYLFHSPVYSCFTLLYALCNRELSVSHSLAGGLKRVVLGTLGLRPENRRNRGGTRREIGGGGRKGKKKKKNVPLRDRTHNGHLLG